MLNEAQKEKTWATHKTFQWQVDDESIQIKFRSESPAVSGDDGFRVEI